MKPAPVAPQTIHSPFPSLQLRLQRARALLEAEMRRYMTREDDEMSMSGPLSLREKVEAAVFTLCEELCDYADAREMLYLALEHPALAQVVPSMYDPGVAPGYDDNDDVSAAYLLSQACFGYLAEQLWSGWRADPACCEICGRESAAWWWTPDPLDPAGDSWGIGQACKAKLDAGEALTYQWNRVNGASRSQNLRPILLSDPPTGRENSPSPAWGQTGAAASSPAGYRSLAERERRAGEELAQWFAQCLRSTRGRLPGSHTLKARVRRLAAAYLPAEEDATTLLLLALDAPALAEASPPDLVALLRKQEGKITAAQLLRSNLSLHLLQALGRGVQQQLRAYWSARSDGCEICQREQGAWTWYPFAAGSLRFALPGQPRRDEPAFRLGPACKAILERGGDALHFTHQRHLYHASSTEGVIACPGRPACLTQLPLTSCEDGQE